MPDKQGMDRLNSELLEEEQVQKALSPVAKEHISEQVTTQSLPPANTTKQTAPSSSLSESALINFGEYLILKVKQWVECR